jgi:hypothetical protein
VDSSGNVYVAGSTRGTLPEQTSAGASDAFVAKYDSSGMLAWLRQFGTSGDEYGYDVSVDASGNAYVVGHTSGRFSGQTNAGAGDAFVTKFDSVGTQEWTQQIGTSSYDLGGGVSVDASGNAYVSGYTSGALPGQTSAGLSDAFIMKYDGSGTLQWTWQFGGSGNDYGYGSAVNASGHAYVAGFTTGELPGQTSAGAEDAFIEQVVP